MQIFDLTPHQRLGRNIAQAAGRSLAPIEFRAFKGGQHKIRPKTSVRGEDVFVISCLHNTEDMSVNDHLIRMLFFIAACRDHGADRVTAVVPWLPYARKDRVTQARDPVNSRYVAQLFEAVGTEMLITVDVHNLAAFQNGFRCRTVNLDGVPLFATEVAKQAGDVPVTILSPDFGGVKRAELLRLAVEGLRNKPTDLAVVGKHRSADVIRGDLFAGEVTGHHVWILDDMIESGATMLHAVEECRKRGARAMHLMATHAFCNGPIVRRLLDPAISSLTVTDTVRTVTTPVQDARVRTLSVAPLIGRCLERIHNGQPISPVLDPAGPNR